MLPDYADIRKRIDEDPLWYDEHGVPRYDPFRPSMLGIYDDLAILMVIECQSCGTPFKVGLGKQRALERAFGSDASLPTEHGVGSWHYGDPPRGCCAAGATMNSVPRRVLEAWKRKGVDWVRVPEHEHVYYGFSGWGDTSGEE